MAFQRSIRWAVLTQPRQDSNKDAEIRSCEAIGAGLRRVRAKQLQRVVWLEIPMLTQLLRPYLPAALLTRNRPNLDRHQVCTDLRPPLESHADQHRGNRNFPG
jgi:hypothetical protein